MSACLVLKWLIIGLGAIAGGIISFRTLSRLLARILGPLGRSLGQLLAAIIGAAGGAVFLLWIAEGINLLKC